MQSSYEHFPTWNLVHYFGLYCACYNIDTITNTSAKSFSDFRKNSSASIPKNSTFSRTIKFPLRQRALRRRIRVLAINHKNIYCVGLRNLNVIGKSFETALVVMYTAPAYISAGCGLQTAAWGGFGQFSKQLYVTEFWHSQIICQVIRLITYN